MAGGLFGGGDGSELNPLLVEDAADLNEIREDMTLHYKQVNDIDLLSFGPWTPLPEGPPFMGVYDGNKKKITNLSINNPTGYKQALFAALHYDAIVKDLDVFGTCEGEESCALIVGTASEDSIIENCRAIGSVKGVQAVGLIVGYSSGIVNKVYSEGNALIEGLCNNVGGIAGKVFSGSITNFYSRATVTAINSDVSWPEAGGLIGCVEGDSALIIDKGYSVGPVSVNQGDNVGGAIGRINGTPTITNCYYDMELSGQSDNDGRGTPKTTAQMKDKNTFATWDFINTWRIDPRIKTGFPIKGPVVCPGIKPGSFKQKNEGYPFLR